MVDVQRVRWSRLLLCLIVGAAVVATPTAAQAQGGPGLVFADEFDGSHLDTARWHTGQYWGRTPTWPAPNGDGTTNEWNRELTAYYASQSTVGGGTLKLTASDEVRPAWRQGGYPYPSARYASGLVETEGKFSFLYGRVEVRAKVPAGKGLHPAIWMMSAQRRWPPEIDIMESIGSQPDRVYHNVHWSNGAQPGATVLPSGGRFASEFHTFAIDWSPGLLVWYVDGVERHRVEGLTKVPNEPMYLILNVAVGGVWPGSPDASTPFPATMEVDWVRVWQQQAGGSAAGSPPGSPTAGGDPTLWLADGHGKVTSLGRAAHFGDTAGRPLNRPIVGMARTTSRRGYWLLAGDGGVFSFGDAAFHGSTGALRLNRPVVGMARTHGGAGYWLVASDGGVFSFGDARFFGSTGALRLVRPVNAITPTPTGAGYWLLADDGGVFSFGDARFHGSAGDGRLGGAVVSMASTSDGSGYWLASTNGRVAGFGSARHHGDLSGRAPAAVAAIQPTGDGNGYWLVGTDGSVHAFGSASPMSPSPKSSSGIAAATS